MVKLPMSQSDLLTIAMVKRTYLQEDWQDFQDFNPIKFTNQFLQDYDAAILAARDVPLDEVVVDEGVELTNTLNEKMETSRKLYKVVKYFVEEAYQTNEARKSRFGLDDYEDARRVPAKMWVFLSNLHKQCTYFQQDLMNVGLSLTKINEIATLRDEIQTALVAQKGHAGVRIESTQSRGEIFTTLYSFIQQTCKVGKIIYEDENDAKYRRYLMPKSNDSSIEKDTIISANTQKALIDEGITETSSFELINTGDVPLIFYIVENISDTAPSNAMTLNAGENATVIASEISSGDYNLLVARNNSTQSGSCKAYMLTNEE